VQSRIIMTDPNSILLKRIEPASPFIGWKEEGGVYERATAKIFTMSARPMCIK
jgi:hypothetical protein